MPADRSVCEDRRLFLATGAATTWALATGPLGSTAVAVPATAEAPATVPEQLSPAHPDSLPADQAGAKLRELLGVERIRGKVRSQETGVERTGDGLRSSRLSYTNQLGETVPAILLQPVNARPRSRVGIVCMSGTSGTAERITRSEFRRAKPGQGALLGWARELSRRGFVTLSITLKGTESRRVSANHWEKQGTLLAPFGRTLMGAMVDEALRAARILEEVETVDPQRITLTGMSLGGNVTWYAMACEPTIHAGVPVCGGVGSLRQQIHGDTSRHTSYFFVPHLLRYFDHPQIVAACICPRPFMAVSPTEDEDMMRSGVDEMIRVVQPAYAAAGQAHRFKVYQPNSNHGYKKEYFEWVVAWLKKFG